MGNMGDEAILSVPIEELKFRHIKPIILSADLDRTIRLHNTPPCCDKLLSLGFWKEFPNFSIHFWEDKV